MCIVRINDDLMPQVGSIDLIVKPPNQVEHSDLKKSSGTQPVIEESVITETTDSGKIEDGTEKKKEGSSWLDTIVKYSPINLKGIEYREVETALKVKILAIEDISHVPLETIHEFLLSEDHFKSFSLEWLPGLAKELDDWISSWS